MRSKKIAVEFNVEFNPDSLNLQRVDEEWRFVCDERWYHVAETSHWFRPNTFAVYRFAGADTAALSSGAIWYDKITEDLSSEREALLALISVASAEAGVHA